MGTNLLPLGTWTEIGNPLQLFEEFPFAFGRFLGDRNADHGIKVSWSPLGVWHAFAA
jgi:hypothetical protein